MYARGFFVGKKEEEKTAAAHTRMTWHKCVRQGVHTSLPGLIPIALAWGQTAPRAWPALHTPSDLDDEWTDIYGIVFLCTQTQRVFREKRPRNLSWTCHHWRYMIHPKASCIGSVEAQAQHTQASRSDAQAASPPVTIKTDASGPRNHHQLIKQRQTYTATCIMVGTW